MAAEYMEHWRNFFFYINHQIQIQMKKEPLREPNSRSLSSYQNFKPKQSLNSWTVFGLRKLLVFENNFVYNTTKGNIFLIRTNPD